MGDGPRVRSGPSLRRTVSSRTWCVPMERAMRSGLSGSVGNRGSARSPRIPSGVRDKRAPLQVELLHQPWELQQADARVTREAHPDQLSDGASHLVCGCAPAGRGGSPGPRSSPRTRAREGRRFISCPVWPMERRASLLAGSSRRRGMPRSKPSRRSSGRFFSRLILERRTPTGSLVRKRPLEKADANGARSRPRFPRWPSQ